jgi:hypothetical protein
MLFRETVAVYCENHVRDREERKKVGGGSERHYIRGTRNYISGFEGSQAVPGCPSGIGNAY